jgi:hypothetical protein
MRCPYCGQDFATHNGGLCPMLDTAMSKQVRAIVQLLQDEQDEKTKQLALSSSIVPQRYPLDNGVGNGQMICPFNLNRGIVYVYNDDAADAWLGEDRQHVEDPTKRFPLKAKSGIAFTSPNELWAIGGAAGPQNVFVLELPPGRQAAEMIALVGSLGQGAQTLIADNADGQAVSATALDLLTLARLEVFNGTGWDRLHNAGNATQNKGLAISIQDGFNVALATVTGIITGGGSLSGMNILATFAQPALYTGGTNFEAGRTPNKFIVVALGAGTAETTIWTPTGGKKFRLMGFLLTCGAASTLTFKDNTAGTTIFAARGPLDTPISPNAMINGILSAAANNLLTVTRGTSCTLDGVVWGTEE